MRFVFSVVIAFLFTNALLAQDLPYYVEQAQTNSPLIHDNKNQSEAARLEIERLKAFYTKAQVTLTGSYQLAPIISQDNGKNEWVLNPENATRYSGYDLAASNGGVYQGMLNWNQPLFNGERYKVMAEQTAIGAQINENTILLTSHDLEKMVTDQYILCIQDYKQVAYMQKLLAIINDQTTIINKLVASGLAKQSDLTLLTIEQKMQEAALNNFHATYRRDLMDLRVMSGVADTTYQILPSLDLQLSEPAGPSHFTDRYRLDSLNLEAVQKSFELKYKPQLNLFANTGLNAVYAPTIANRFGFSAGLNFVLTLTDGRQRSLTQQRTAVMLHSTKTYTDFFYNQNSVRKKRIRNELVSIDERLTLLESQVQEYEKLLNYYKLELSRGQLSVINYVTTVKSMLGSERDLVLLQTTKQQLINLYNYWNW